MRISKKKFKALEKKVADLEGQIQSQQNKKGDIRKINEEEFNLLQDKYAKDPCRLRFPT